MHWTRTPSNFSCFCILHRVSCNFHKKVERNPRRVNTWSVWTVFLPLSIYRLMVIKVSCFNMFSNFMKGNIDKVYVGCQFVGRKYFETFRNFIWTSKTRKLFLIENNNKFIQTQDISLVLSLFESMKISFLIISFSR